MSKRILFILILLFPVFVHAKISVKSVDLLEQLGVEVNAAGPLWVQMDTERGRIIVANTLSSSLSLIDGETHAVTNIPLSGRALQHLKAEAMTYGKRNGKIYLIGTKCFHIISPDTKQSRTIDTEVQFESIAVDEASGNIFVTGRESKEMGFYDASNERFERRKWLDHEEKLINLNQTPPPPIRKVIADGGMRRIIAVDGFTASLYLFDAETGEALESRSLELSAAGAGIWPDTMRSRTTCIS